MKAAPATFSRDLESGRRAPVYLLHGVESHLIDKAQTELVERLVVGGSDFNFEQYSAAETTPGQIVSSLAQMDVFGGERVVLVKHLEEVKTDWLEGLIDAVLNPPPTSRLVLTAHQRLKKNTRFYKAVDKVGVTVEFAPLTEKEIHDWLDAEAKRQGKRLSAEARLVLIARAGTNLADLEAELTKLVLFVHPAEEITADDVRSASAERKGYDNFALGEAVGRRDGLQALAILDRLMQTLGEAGGPLLVGLMAHKLRTLIQARELLDKGLPPAQAARSLRLPARAARDTVEQAGSFTPARLAEALLELSETDLKIKTGGAVRENLEAFILRICG